ncbi:hypothetical protein B0H34DRAFT_673825 [Crassisporium funariophilum]|nr:hypothetical protein B0H34DRAFT_673825 [Crassisporium funariophilum]
MAAAVFQGVKSNNPFHKSSNQRLAANSPIPSTSSSRPSQPSDGGISALESSGKTFQKLRSSLEQSLRTATRSKKLPPPPIIDEFAAVTVKKDKGKEKEREREREKAAKNDDKMNMLRRVTFRRATPSPVPPVKDGERVAGFTSYITPSLRQASMSSPALHMSSQALPSPKSQSAIPGSSSSNADVLASPTRQRARKASLQPQIQSQSREIGVPVPLVAKLDVADSNAQAPSTPSRQPISRHRATKSHTPTLPPLPSSHSPPSRDREPATPTRTRRDPTTPPDTPTPRGLVRNSSKSSTIKPASPRPPSPIRARSPAGAAAARVRVGTPTGVRGLASASASASHLPLSSSSTSTPPHTPTTRRTSVDATRRTSGEARRPSIDNTPRRSSRDSPSAGLVSSSPPSSPSSSPIRARAISPVQRSYAQNRHFNISSGSLVLPPPSSPSSSSHPEHREHREVIRTATSMLCREVVKPPVHMMRTEAGVRDWEEVEVRDLGEEWGWGVGGVGAAGRSEVGGGAAGRSEVNVSSAGLAGGSGEERERKLFCETLRDGYVLCQLMNKLRSSSIVRPDAREDGFVRNSNITKFLAACASYGLPNEDLFLRDDLIEGTSESLARVARTVVRLVEFVDTPAPSRLKYLSGHGKPSTPTSGGQSQSLYAQGSISRASASTPNLLLGKPSSPSPSSPVRKRWSPPSDLPTLRSNSPEEGTGSASSQDHTIRAGASKSPSPPHNGNARQGKGEGEEKEENGNEAEYNSVPVPQMMKPPPPPKSPLRKASNKQLALDAGGLFTWARSAASPTRSSGSVADSTRASIGDSMRDSVGDLPTLNQHPRQSIASSALSDATTALSSYLDGGRSSSGGNMFGTIRTMTTDLTSEAPSMSRAEGDLVADMVRKRSTSELGMGMGMGMGMGGMGMGGKYGRERERERKMSEVGGVDLGRVAEETDESVSSKGHVRERDRDRGRDRDRERERGKAGDGRDGREIEKPAPAPAVNLKKGKWPEDFIDAFRTQPQSISTKDLFPDQQEDSITPVTTSSSSRHPRSTTPISISPPRKLAIVGASASAAAARRGGEGQGTPEPLAPLPRRPTHRPRHSIDTPGLLPKESILRREASPDGTSTAASSSPGGGGRVMLRRHSTKPGPGAGGAGGVTGARNGILMPRHLDEQGHTPTSDREGSDSPVPFPGVVPFPRTVSGERGTPSPRSSGAEPPAPNERPRVLRGRFQSEVEGSSSRRRARPSEVEGSSSRRRARPSSYDELGGKPVRSRFESMVNLGAASGSGAASASDLMARERERDGVDGSAVRMRLVVREDGKPPTHFQLGNCIGRGQFGSVYRALNLNTGQMVAVKRIRLEGLKEEEVTTLMREVDLVKSLSHPSIVKYEGMARDEDTLNIVLEYAENGSLGQTLKAFGKFNERLAASYVVKILEGLHYLHTSDVVHCDLKAANILTTKNGNIKLSDFGVSLNLRAMEREMENVAGTPNWMAPEVIELKGASGKSDIWSLGCTVIELLTGRPPYAEIANSMSVMFRIVEDAMPPLPEGCSDLLQDFLQQCFHKDPSKRPSAEILCEHLWLKKNWVALKDLRPQDSIPFLRRVSTDLQKSEAVRYLSQLELPESPMSASPKRGGDVGKISPIGRRTSNSSVRPGNNDFSPREHSFVKTTFSKPMVCRVCLLNVKKSAVLCSQCSLISHTKCAIDAPPTCDLRAQLLLYAQYAEKGNPASAYSNPADILNDISQNVAMSDVPFVDYTSRTSLDNTPPPHSPVNAEGAEHPPTAFKFMAAFRRSRTNLSPEPVAHSASSTPPAERLRKRPSHVLQKQRERPLSVTSTSTGLSSLRSAATAAESFSSRQNTGQRSHASGGSADKGKRSMSTPMEKEKGAKVTSSARSEATTADYDDARSTDLPGSLPADARRHKRGSKGSGSGNCMVQ